MKVKDLKKKILIKYFKRFYSNRPKMFGEHSGLGLNIVKNLVELHNGSDFVRQIMQIKKVLKLKLLFQNLI